MIETRPDRQTLLDWLREDDDARLEQLWNEADKLRARTVGDAVHLRGLIEISNRCFRQCTYCGLRGANTQLARYRMPESEILECAQMAERFGYGTVVLQSGEDVSISAEWVTRVVERIKNQTSLAVTLSLGERRRDELVRWRNAGADRYLLRFETSNRKLYDHIHPKAGLRSRERRAVLADLRELGYEVGSGVMVGIPGQSYEDLARDIEWFARLDLDMIGSGPFIAHPGTPLGDDDVCRTIRDECECSSADQTPNTQKMGYKVIALARLVCPRANIPSTTALATLDGPQGRELGLVRGANVIMPNLTPLKYRQLYEIYPQKASSQETAEQTHAAVVGLLERMGRVPGAGRGDSPRFAARA